MQSSLNALQLEGVFMQLFTPIAFSLPNISAVLNLESRTHEAFPLRRLFVT